MGTARFSVVGMTVAILTGCVSGAPVKEATNDREAAEEEVRQELYSFQAQRAEANSSTGDEAVGLKQLPAAASPPAAGTEASKCWDFGYVAVCCDKFTTVICCVGSSDGYTCSQ